MKQSFCSGRDLQTLLDSIKSSEVVENRVQLLKELGKIELSEKSAVNSVVESLITLWEEFTCLDISQCTLHRTILQVATKYLESDISGCLVQFLVLGIKANIWCRKHLKMTLMSTQDSPEEEHSSFFYQLVLDLFCYSAATYSALARCLVLTSKELMVSLENFISEHLTLTKDLVSEMKNIHTLGPELLKGAQMALDAVTRLCRVYCNGVEWDIYNAKIEVDKGDCKEAELGVHVIVVTNCTIEKLCELGIIAANDGGSLVSLLNTSWKGVVSLLQLGKGSLAEKVNITGVITTLTSLASASLRCAAETWSSSITEKVSEAEAKRTFLPVKFYLINAVRIISQYQTQAFFVYKEIALCVVMILTFRISLSKIEHLNSASHVLAEILEPTSLHLLNSLLNSAQVKEENKFQILDWLFSNESDMVCAAEVSSTNDSFDSLDALFSVSFDAMNKEKIFTLGRVSLFLNLLKGAADLEDDVRLGIARKLGWLLDTLVDEDVYSSILVLKIPILHGSAEPNYHPVFCAVLHALKTFMITVSSSLAWKEVESFLIENLFHPHFLCWEIITELWCFILRHADTDMVNDVIDKICSLLRLTSSESVLSPDSVLRKTARLICILVKYGPQLMADQVYSSVLDCNRSQCPSSVYTALLMEGFPLNSLSEKNRSIAKQRVVTQYFDFLETFEEKSPGQSNSGVYGAPVFALCAALESLQVSLSDSDMKTLKFLVAIIRKYKMSTDTAIKDNYRALLGELLGIISNMKHLYSSDEMEGVILELQKLFISKPELSDCQLFLCKPNLAYFMAGLGHVELADSDARSLAEWELYHMLLRERHWAFVHLAITAFGYFAAHTSCNELWRFVPQDAALSYDLESGNEADEERFMSELKVFLEKERACPILQANLDQLEVLVKEGQMLKEIVQNNITINLETTICDMMEIDDEKQPNKKRKFPDGICKGVELLQNGLKIMVDGLSQWQQNQCNSTEVHKKFLSHFSRLEDVIAHLVSLADSD
ncbi:hypothetical protein ACJIZ3_017146 [Penstemon smallii]|uniref:Uncharacterized protein n=1 Tax=Penstemon smallii TaxID=265156 RepID=A0ABD3SUR0_9LAMI